MRLSVFDILSPVYVPRLLPELDLFGYHRFWATEHHTPTQSASPTLVACLAAAMTARMRVGTAGILINYACPAKVAEDFRLLELYFSGRIDLGVSGASILNDQLYLDGRSPLGRASYAKRVRTLVDLVRGNHDVVLGPIGSTRPALWLCGASVASAVLAGELGMYFACHNRGTPEDSPRTVIAAYRAAYDGDDAPCSVIAAHGVCAETEQAARRQWSNPSAPPCFAGTPEACVEQLAALVSGCGADEAVIHLHVHDIDARIVGYGLLAEAAGLEIERAVDTAANAS
jgi:alkanesulfonate monooxygenase SsuD/methylene tetrahydromethanopterin reductase-like flavin-dependent oxidoreductase (luciferase family)